MLRSLVLGHQLRGCLEDGRATSLTQLGQWLHLTHARVSKLLTLTLLAPEIQEQLLLVEDWERIRLTEQRVRHIASEPDWQRQRTRWAELYNNGVRRAA